MAPTSKDWAILAMHDVTPDNLTVGGNLNLIDTAITSLPDNLIVGGHLNLSDTAIASLPDNLTVGGHLNLCNTGIASLPDNLTVSGWLDLSDTGITSLPADLSVGGTLDLSDTAIPVIYHDSRGHELRRVVVGSQEWFAAGCRFFRSRQEALNHWGSPDYPDKTRGEAYCNAIRENNQ